MNVELNPFHELYVTETARPKEFVQLFSRILIDHSLLLFQPGNVVLRGTQGTGKSMLLNLLKADIRIAYNNEAKPFPVPDELSNYLGVGINLVRSGIMDIGQRPVTQDMEKEEALFPLYFADFLNYWVVLDIIKSITNMLEHRRAFVGVLGNGSNDSFATLLAKEDCWFDYLGGITTFAELKSKIEQRIRTYRAFNQYNISELPSDIRDTKTAIGEPISRAAECLVKSGVVIEGVPLFIRIDQHETLSRSDVLRASLGCSYRRMINKALSRRDPRVFYRVGTRPYAWDDETTVYGMEIPVEALRDYRIIDLDDILRRREDRTTWIFPAFAMDVFEKRLQNAGFDIESDDPFKDAMGKSPDPITAANRYAGNSDPAKAIGIEYDWPSIWKNYLLTLYDKEKLSARLASAWLRQTGVERGRRQRIYQDPPQNGYPWNSTWWRKERVRQALMQIAASCGQRLEWYGKDHILSLSAGGILMFVSICQHIWDAFLRSERGKPKTEVSNPLLDGIDWKVQAVGIQSASNHWYDKIAEWPGGSDRQRFVDIIGRRYRYKLINDKAMSYPGHNGFSLLKEELEADDNRNTRHFLQDAVDYGDLFSVQHTTRTKDRRQRVKWYLNPILSPYFGIPESHTKEPEYVEINEVVSWINAAHNPTVEFFEAEHSAPSSTEQLNLFQQDGVL